MACRRYGVVPGRPRPGSVGLGVCVIVSMKRTAAVADATTAFWRLELTLNSQGREAIDQDELDMLDVAHAESTLSMTDADTRDTLGRRRIDMGRTRARFRAPCLLVPARVVKAVGSWSVGTPVGR